MALKRNTGNRFTITPTILSTYLLDIYPATAAFSTRQLSSTATNCIKVRRESDSVEADIGFVDGWLDEAAIATHCGASNGWVITWYDQSGNGHNAIQTNQAWEPQIYNGSSVFSENGKPTVTFPLSNDELNITFSPGIPHPFVSFSVSQNNSLFSRVIHYADAGGTAQYLFGIPDFGWRMYGSGSLVSAFDQFDSNQVLMTASFNSLSSVMRKNGSQIKSGSMNSVTVTEQKLGGLGNTTDKMQEIIFYDSDQSANFAPIESDINSAFGVYA